MTDREKLEIRIQGLKEAKEIIEREGANRWGCEYCDDDSGIAAPAVAIDERIRDLEFDIRRLSRAQS